jgi:hypothetical protein
LDGILKIAEAAASAGADFDACNRTGDADVIRSRFKKAADLCDAVDDIDQVMTVYDLAYSARTRLVKARGGVCLGDYQKRFDLITGAIKKLHDRCLDE